MLAAIFWRFCELDTYFSAVDDKSDLRFYINSPCVGRKAHAGKMLKILKYEKFPTGLLQSCSFANSCH